MRRTPLQGEHLLGDTERTSPVPPLEIPKSAIVSVQMVTSVPFQGTLSAPKSQRFLRFAIAMPIADPKNLFGLFLTLYLARQK